MPANSFTGFLILCIALLGGVLVSAQGMINGRLNVIIGNPLHAALISFTGGWIILLTLSIATGAGLPNWSKLVDAPWWVYLGGIAGSYMVATTAFGVPRIGATAWISAIIVGQLVGSVAFDHFGAFGLEVRTISWEKIVGIIALIFGTWLVIKP